MDISIVVPFHNEERHIEGSIRALLALDYPEDRYEIIMVDNNSTDRSAEICARFERVRLFAEPIQGDFAARNRGIAESRGAVIAFTDSDTAPFPDWLQRIAERMADPSVQLVVGNLQFAPSSRLLALIAEYEAGKNEYIFSRDVKEIYYGYTCNMIVRKSLFDRLGPFPPVFRNADVVLVRKVVDELGCAAARYAADIRVRRLEVASIWDYFAKQHVYGRDLSRYGIVANARPLNNTERLTIFRSLVHRRDYSTARAALLFVLLALGGVYYELGRLRGA